MRVPFLKFAFLGAIALLTIAQRGHAEQTYVIPVREGVPGFESAREVGKATPQFILSTRDRLKEVRRERNSVLVRDPQQREFWVHLKDVAQAPSRRFLFDGAQVSGYLDSPNPVFILDADDPTKDVIRIDRSFSDLLREHKDQDAFRRTSGMGPHRTELL